MFLGAGEGMTTDEIRQAGGGGCRDNRFLQRAGIGDKRLGCERVCVRLQQFDDLADRGGQDDDIGCRDGFPAASRDAGDDVAVEGRGTERVVQVKARHDVV